MLALILSPLGRWLAGATVLAALLLGAYGKGRLDQSRRDNLASHIALIANLRASIENTAEVARRANQRAASLAADAVSLQTKVSDYEAELAKEPADCGCRLNQRDVDSLRGIARPGKTGAPGRP